MKNGTRHVVPIETLMEALGLSRSQTFALIQDGTLPRASRGGYDLVACVRAYVEHLRSERGDADAIALRKVKAERAALELHVRRDQVARAEVGRSRLVPLDEMLDFFAAMVVVYTRELAAFPTRFAPMLAGLSDPRDPHAVFAVLQPAHDAAINEANRRACIELVGVDPTPSANGNGRAT